MPDCVDCGAPVKNKNAAGHYRDRCCRCICDVAGADPADARPIPGCECDDCRDARAEIEAKTRVDNAR